MKKFVLFLMLIGVSAGSALGANNLRIFGDDVVNGRAGAFPGLTDGLRVGRDGLPIEDGLALGRDDLRAEINDLLAIIEGQDVVINRLEADAADLRHCLLVAGVAGFVGVSVVSVLSFRALSRAGFAENAGRWLSFFVRCALDLGC
jgi:hypothetical protein